MSLLSLSEKVASSQNPFLIGKSKINQESAAFDERVRQIKNIIINVVPQDRQRELLAHIEQLHEIYLSDTQRDRVKFERNDEEGRFKGTDRVILQVREGAKFNNSIKIQGQLRPKSPEKKAEEKKFVKFQPKKVKGEVTVGLGNILKSG